ncbi:hypothetical protein Tco_1557043 [Tanacetum coccineum]
MLRLKVSLSKTALYGINIDQTQLQQYAPLMGCCVGNFLFEYLGVPIGINPRRISAWHKVINKFKLETLDRGEIPCLPVTLTASSVWKKSLTLKVDKLSSSPWAQLGNGKWRRTSTFLELIGGSGTLGQDLVGLIRSFILNFSVFNGCPIDAIGERRAFHSHRQCFDGSGRRFMFMVQ